MTNNLHEAPFPEIPNYRPRDETHSGEYLVSAMSLRDWFAGMAMQGMLSRHVIARKRVVARKAYEVADAMLAERPKPQSLS